MAGAAAARPLAAKAAKVAEVGALASAARSKAPRVKLKGGYASAQRPVITTMTVTIGLAFLHAWLVEKQTLPEKRLIVRLAILGFVLSLFTELSPKFGKGMSYLILTGVVFDRSSGILRELLKLDNGTGGTLGTDIPPDESPLTPQAEPVRLYRRQGPMTTEPLLPARSRIKRPQRGAWAQA